MSLWIFLTMRLVCTPKPKWSFDEPSHTLDQVTSIKRICVFAGSSPGTRDSYVATARALGRELCEREYGLVFGGSQVGLMGAIAETVLENGGEVVGVIPDAIASKVDTHPGLTELHVVGTMHERKAFMAKVSDAFVALPGGLGTLEELFEVLTWAQLGIHRKPGAIVNVEGYYDGLLEFLDHAVEERFIKPAHKSMLLVDANVVSLLDAIDQYEPPLLDKWMDREQI